MTDAPETIWAAPPWDDGMWESGSGEWNISENWAVDRKVPYRLASLPATNAQIKDHPKVKALKCHLEMARLWLYVDGRFDLQGIDAALAALETDEPTPTSADLVERILKGGE